VSDQSSESQDHAALDAEFLDLLEQDRALHAKLADVAGRMIAHKAQEAVRGPRRIPPDGCDFR